MSDESGTPVKHTSCQGGVLTKPFRRNSRGLVLPPRSNIHSSEMLVPYAPRKAPKKNQLVPTGKVPEQVKQYVKAQLSVALEPNHYDKSGSNPITPVIAPAVMNLIPVVNREGECVNMTSVRFSWTLTDGSSTALNTSEARVIVFEWKALRLPTASDILETLTGAAIVNSPHRFTMRQFYRIISDEKVLLNPNCAVGKSECRDIKLGGVKKRFDDGAVPPETLGLLYFLAVSDDATINAPVFNYNVRTVFTDA